MAIPNSKVTSWVLALTNTPLLHRSLQKCLCSSVWVGLLLYMALHVSVGMSITTVYFMPTDFSHSLLGAMSTLPHSEVSFKKLRFIYYYLYMCVFVGVWAQECRFPQRLEEGIRFHWSWNFKLWHSTRGLRLSGRAVVTLNCWANEFWQMYTLIIISKNISIGPYPKFHCALYRSGPSPVFLQQSICFLLLYCYFF